MGDDCVQGAILEVNLADEPSLLDGRDGFEWAWLLVAHDIDGFGHIVHAVPSTQVRVPVLGWVTGLVVGGVWL